MTPRRIDDQEDRISNLPRHLLSSILDCMLIRDAARTSVLSKTWKSIWETHPHILLRKCQHFTISFHETKEVSRSRYVGAINSILLAHRGPIVKFVLFMPRSMQLHNSPYYPLWIKQLPEKGLRYLELHNDIENPTNNIPSYFFSCSELTRLLLVNCKLNPPSKFGGFGNLTEILLQQVTFTADMSFGAQVRHFELTDCAGIEHLDGQFTNHGKNINIFNIGRSVDMEKRYAPSPHYYNKKKSFNLHRLLGDMPSIEFLILNATSLEFLDPGLTLHNQLSTTMDNLKKLKLINIAFNHLNVISNAFCLLRGMPVLEHLEIKVGPDMKDENHIKLKAEQYLESLDCANIIMNQLQTVVMKNVMGSRAEILLINLLLASCPSLRSMTFESCCSSPENLQ